MSKLFKRKLATLINGLDKLGVIKECEHDNTHTVYEVLPGYKMQYTSIKDGEIDVTYDIDTIILFDNGITISSFNGYDLWCDENQIHVLSQIHVYQIEKIELPDMSEDDTELMQRLIENDVDMCNKFKENDIRMATIEQSLAFANAAIVNLDKRISNIEDIVDKVNRNAEKLVTAMNNIGLFIKP